MITAENLQQRLDAFIEKTICPGAQLAVFADGEIIAAASGVLNANTGYEVTNDSLFQIGSITKVWTATMVMQLVDEGKVDLDAPVKTYLEDFTLADPDRAEAVTVRHLLSHTSGIEGDVFDDAGMNPDMLERYVAAMANIGVVYDLEETWSYCNSGWVLLGRLIEVVGEVPYEVALQERLVKPLGMGPVATRADQAIIHRVSVGHTPNQEAGTIDVAPAWSLPMALLPAGLVTTSATDLIRFAALHLNEGLAADGTKVLSAESVRAMQQVQAECPEVDLLADSWGLGFWIRHWGKSPVIGHGGNTIGQSAYFDMVPAKGVAVALLTNVSGASLEATDLVKELLAELAGVEAPAFPSLPEAPADIDLEPYVGIYERYGFNTETVIRDGHLEALMTPTGFAAEMGGKPETLVLIARGPGDFLVAPKDEPFPSPPMPVRFYGGPEGNKFVHMGGRVAPRK